jgi:spore germination protein GerM
MRFDMKFIISYIEPYQVLGSDKITTMKKLLILCFSIVFFLSSCSKKAGEESFAAAPGTKVTVYFTKASDELGVVLIPVVRKVTEGRSAYETAIRELFLGPTLEEREKMKLSTEVPDGARLNKVTESQKEVIIDISAQFMLGGGSETMQVRFRQLRETALNLAKGRPVFLYMDGSLVQKIGGEGLEIPQPLSKKLD